MCSQFLDGKDVSSPGSFVSSATHGQIDNRHVLAFEGRRDMPARVARLTGSRAERNITAYRTSPPFIHCGLCRDSRPPGVLPPLPYCVRSLYSPTSRGRVLLSAIWKRFASEMIRCAKFLTRKDRVSHNFSWNSKSRMCAVASDAYNINLPPTDDERYSAPQSPPCFCIAHDDVPLPPSAITHCPRAGTHSSSPLGERGG